MNYPDGFGPITRRDLEQLRRDLEQHDVDVAQARARVEKRYGHARPMVQVWRPRTFRLPPPRWQFGAGGGS